MDGVGVGNARRKGTTAVLIMVLVSALAGCGRSGGRETQTLKGAVILFDTSDAEGGLKDCHGVGSLSDLQGGAKVTVKDDEDKVIVVSKLDHFASSRALVAHVEASANAPKNAATAAKLVADGVGADAVCPLLFTVDVPDSEVYSIEIGERDAVVVERKDLEKSNFTVTYMVGNVANVD
jgi:hypothetical protein